MSTLLTPVSSPDRCTSVDTSGHNADIDVKVTVDGRHDTDVNILDTRVNTHVVDTSVKGFDTDVHGVSCSAQLDISDENFDTGVNHIHPH